MKQGNFFPVRVIVCIAAMVMLSAGTAWSQAGPAGDASLSSAVHDLQQQVQELRAAVSEMRSEAAQYRAETAELRRELQQQRGKVAGNQPGSLYGAASAVAPETSSAAATATTAPAGSSLEQRVSVLEDSTQLLNSKVDDQYQTKVSSASKYRVRLSGLALLNVFSNRGVTDNQDIPTWAVPRTPFSAAGNFGATLRQSEIGLEVFGPRLAGARTSGNIQVDFAGGFPNTFNGSNFGLLRLRIASMHLDWDHTSVVAGQDDVFISPLSPTSFASLAVPAFSYAGNLWGWIPQVRVEHHFDVADNQHITVQAGILDNVTGEPPYDSYLRIPQAGERSSQPAYAGRIAWTRDVAGQPLTVGGATYYSRQDYGFHRHVDGWAGMADVSVPVGQKLALSGEFYRGVAIGGLGGGIGRSVTFSGDPTQPTSSIQPLRSIGGWGQLKLKATPKLEFNGAVGLDNPFAEDVRGYSSASSYLSSLVQNRSALINFIYRPRSNLLFSTEYRHLRTQEVDREHWQADQVNMIMGILF